MLDRVFSLLRVNRKLILGKNATLVSTSSTGVETSISATELAALNDLSATDLAKIDGITNGTGAASKALVLDSSGNVAMPDNGAIALSRAAVAAAGTTAADATVLADQVNAVTASDGAKGVALPAAATTTGPIYVINTVLTSGADLKVYPVNGGNDNINGGAEDAAFVMGPGAAAWFIPTSATQWYVSDKAGVLTTKAEENILDGVTATAAELNYLDIETLGTGVASKAVVLDSGEDYTWPAAGVLTYGVLKDPAATTLTATALEMNRACDVSARLVAAGSTLAVTVAAHDGKTILLDTAGGSVCTLPVAAGTGARIRFVVSVRPSGGSHIVKVADASGGFAGQINILDLDAAAQGAYLGDASTGDDTITINNTTTGGAIGDFIEVEDTLANFWTVRGALSVPAGSNPADPFSATVN